MQVAFEKLPEPYRSALGQDALNDLKQLPDDLPEIEWLTASHGPENATTSYVSFTPAIMAPVSRGTIGLNSTDTKDNPLVDPNVFSSSTDQKLGLQIYKRLQRFVNATGLTKGPEMKVGNVTTDDEILNGIKQTGLPWYHGIGSCKEASFSGEWKLLPRASLTRSRFHQVPWESRVIQKPWSTRMARCLGFRVYGSLTRPSFPLLFPVIPWRPSVSLARCFRLYRVT